MEINGSEYNTTIANSILFDGNTHTLSVTWDSATGTIEVFVDGAIAHSGIFQTGATIDQGGTVVLGQDQDSVGGGFATNQIFDGTIYGVSLYDDIRSPTELLDSARGPVADTTDPNLIANWVPDPDSATVTDRTGSHTMTLSGDTSATWSADADTILGGDGADTIYGGGGADSIDAGAGNDTVRGGDGNDTITTGSGNVVVYGEDGDDSIDGTAATYGDLYGGAGNDTIVTGANYDDVTAGDGNDHITLGTGGDWVFAGAGDDTAIGSTDADYFYMEGGNDSVAAGDGNDTIEGQADNDTLYGGAGNDVVDGDDGADSVFGDAGADTVWGGSGDDVVSGGADNDSIYGQDGSDTLYGGTGADRVEGNNDADLIVVEDGFGADTIVGGEGVTTGADDDTLDASAVTVGVSVTYSGDEAGTLNDGSDTLSFSEIERLILTEQADVLVGTADSAGLDVEGRGGNDNLLGGAGDDIIDGGADNDSIQGAGGNDSLTGGTGNDTLRGHAGNDTLEGGDGDDRLYDTSGSDVLRGGAGNDSLDGGANNDTLEGGTGNDTLVAFSGADSLSGGDDADTHVIYDGGMSSTVAGGEGGVDQDTLDFRALTNAVTVTYSGDEAGTATDGADTLSFSEIETQILTAQNDSLDGTADGLGFAVDAGAGSDTIFGGSGNDSIDGEAGADSIDGGDGDDHISYAVGGDTVDGGAGNDTIWGGFSAGADDALLRGGGGDDEIITYGANDTVEGGSGNDLIVGDSGDELISGDADDDEIYSNNGADTISGGTGTDTISGGGGNDTFLYAVGDGHDTITDFNTGNSGTISDGDNTNNDFINLSALYDNLSELYADQADDGVLNQSNAADTKGRTVDYSDNAQFGAGDSLSFTGASADSSFYTSENTAVVCFASGTRVLTPRGEVSVDALRPGDLVTTMDNGPMPLLWATTERLSAARLAARPNLRPIRVSGSIAPGGRDLIVSPQHGMVVTCGTEQRLVRAKHLCDFRIPTAELIADMAPVTYIHLAFEGHQIIFANGCPTESFYPGPLAIASLSPGARQRLIAHFPDLGQRGPPLWTPARPYMKRRDLVASGLVAKRTGSPRASLSRLVAQGAASAAVQVHRSPA